MLTGKQKAQFLISLLEDSSNEVLSQLKPDIAADFSSNLEDVPKLNDTELSDFLDEALKEIQIKQQKSTLDLIEGDGESFDELEEGDAHSDLDMEMEEEPVELSTYPKEYRAIETIIKHLEKQSDQIKAFFLHYAEDPLKTDIKEQLSEQTLERLNSVSVNSTPIAKKVFDKVFANIVLKTESEMNPEEDEESTEEELGDL
ncbi:hypothetical protein DID78_04680 [Candidatus Marinamargulisbacteria bacterium SCGC AG-343-D04]|nr:hypothetical protein DID78_04680 [Candidatus Marinamargulisbacteria bacterium SCGC AG-343-D04]